MGVCFQRRCDLNCLSLKLSLIVLAVLLYGNGGGAGGGGLAGFMLSYSYSRKQASERPCSHLQLSPHTQTHTHTLTQAGRDTRTCFLPLRALQIHTCSSVWACKALECVSARKEWVLIVYWTQRRHENATITTKDAQCKNCNNYEAPYHQSNSQLHLLLAG